MVGLVPLNPHSLGGPTYYDDDGTHHYTCGSRMAAYHGNRSHRMAHQLSGVQMNNDLDKIIGLLDIASALDKADTEKKQLAQLLDDHRYTTTLEVGGQAYLVSFQSLSQNIIYTRVDGMDAGKFKARNGWIASNSPADFILQDEILVDIVLKKTRLIQS